MPSSKDRDCVVTVTIELGHQANFLEEPSIEGFTHDWTVFVRGFEGSKLEYFVEKVIFRLHKTFKMPTRVISEPPFRVTESGYAGFILPIEIHFKNKQQPRRINFEYDLFLNLKPASPVNNVRYEKLKFQNPTPEFKMKLLKAGGVEQGVDRVPQPFSELFGHPSKTKTEKKRGPKPSKDSSKEKVKKKKKKELSRADSLSSLSPSSDEDEDKSPPKKEKEPSPPKKRKRKHTFIFKFKKRILVTQREIIKTEVKFSSQRAFKFRKRKRK